MKPETEELYRKNCHFDKNCQPEPRIRIFQNGATHYVTQCNICGFSFGQPYPKKLFKDSDGIKMFDEEFEKKYYEEAHKEMFERTKIQKKLGQLRKQLKADYFKSVLKLPFDNFEIAYGAYLNSSAWQIKRKQILGRDNYLCQFCKEEKATQVHHLSYDNLGNECEFELLSVCHSCHQIIHNIENNEKIHHQILRKEL